MTGFDRNEQAFDTLSSHTSAPGDIGVSRVLASGGSLTMGDRTSICAVEDCGKQAVTRGWCQRHYRRWLRHGDPLTIFRAEAGQSTGTRMRYLRPGDPIPEGEPKRYINVHGYVILRWRVGPCEMVETLEHRVVDGHVTTAPHVHHIDGNKQNNDPSNLAFVDSRTHRNLHRTTSRAEVVRLYGDGQRTTTEVAQLLGTHAGNVYRILIEEGVKVRSGPEMRRAKVDRAGIAKAYAEGMPIKEIGERFGIHFACARGIAAEFGVPSRREGRPRRKEAN